MKVCLELADLSGDKAVTRLPLIRLCADLESKLPLVPKLHLQRIDHLCAIAIEDENCFFMSDDTWLIISISLEDFERFLKEDPERSFSIDELTEVVRHGKIKEIERSLHITIRRNVLPNKGIWKELQESHHCSHWAKEFYSRRSRQESRRQPESPMKKVKERMKQHFELAISQQPNGDDPDAAPLSSQEGERSANREGPVFHAVNAKDIVMVRRLGSGAEGIVWQVVWGNCTYAMKIFKGKEGAYAIEEDFAKSKPVLDPHIVQVFGHSCYVLRSIYCKKQGWGEEDHPRPSLLMELMDASLQNTIYQSSKGTSPVPISFVVKKLDLLSQIASAMQKLHDNNVVHGDLKLGNILVSKYEVARGAQHFLAKVADFDGARRIATSTSFVEEPFEGTTPYAAPEVLKRCRPPRRMEAQVDSKSDVYSFGVVAFEILTEHWAWGFNGADLKASAEHPRTDKQYKVREVADGKRKLIDCKAWSSVRFRYRKEVISLVERCLEINPVERPEFKEICEALSTAKSNHQDLERKTAARIKFVNFVCLFVVAGLVLSCFFHYASAALVTVVVVATSACLTEKWICSDNLIFAFPAQTLRKVYREVIDRLAGSPSPQRTPNQTQQSSSVSSETD